MDIKNKKVVVTGGAGFVGSHLVEMLLGEGAHVVVLDNFSRGINYIDGAVYYRVDAGNTAPCKTHFKDAEIVYNLAAEVAGVIHNRSHNAQMYYKNARVQSAPVVAAAMVGVPRFVQVSSVCIYGRNHTDPCYESFEYNQIGEPVEANSGYSWSKRMGERIAAWADIPTVAIVRPTNIYGPRDYFDDRSHVIPALIKKSHENDYVNLYGSGNEQREFLYVTDAARGMMLAGINAPENRVNVYNLGTYGKTVISIRELAEMIVKIMGNNKRVVAETPDEDVGDSHRYTIAERAQKELGWRHQVGLLEGLQKTIEWWR